MKPPYPLLLVEWEDHCSHGDAWNRMTELSSVDFTPTIHFSVGWEIKRTPKALTLGPNLGCVGDEHNECVSGHFTILLATIRRETILRKGASA